MIKMKSLKLTTTPPGQVKANFRSLPVMTVTLISTRLNVRLFKSTWYHIYGTMGPYIPTVGYGTSLGRTFLIFNAYEYLLRKQ